MNVPAELKYTPTHEWVRREADGAVSIGITDHAQGALGDLVFIELPDVGRRVATGEACAVVESVKAASDIYAPIAGEIIEQNSPVSDSPEQVNQDAYAAWLFRIRPENPGELDKLLDAEAYTATITD